jgi:regulator of sirC expression with transglutaminase-like and TPR domain
VTGHRILTHPMAARERFRRIVELPDRRIDLTEAALVIALEEYPSLQLDHYLEQVDEWSDAIRDRIEGSTDIERIVAEINRFLFEQEGFHGEADDYFDPRYAYLNEVLDGHAGLPIALSILYIEISRRLGVDVSGVSMPGRFLVKVIGPWGELLIDPFDEGRVLTSIECQLILDRVYGGGVRLREHHLRTTTKHEVLARVLSHIKAMHLARGDGERAIADIDRLLLIDRDDPYELRDRGLVAMKVHRYREAIESLRLYLERAPHADDQRRVREQIEYLEAWLSTN